MARYDDDDDDGDGGLGGGAARVWRSVRGALGTGLFSILLLLAVVAGLWGSYYQIEPEEVGLVTRFGAYLGTSQPGPHFKLPFIDRVFRVPVKRQLKEEFGFRTQRAGVQTEYEE